MTRQERMVAPALRRRPTARFLVPRRARPSVTFRPGPPSSAPAATSARIAALALAVLLAAGCDAPDPTAQLPTTPPTTATTTTLAAEDCPLVVVECPRPWITLGAVIASTDGVCTPAYNPRRELSSAEKRRVLAAYGIPPGQKPVELDHLIPRWAGGRSDPSDVWPQFDAAQVARKDALEAQLWRAVCVTKTLSLAEARDRALHFWRYWPAKFTTLRSSHVHD